MNAHLRILHISALQLWAMKGKAGMCCLLETLRGHVRAGFDVTIIIPAYDLWDDGTEPLHSPASEDFAVVVAPCLWLPMVKRMRAWAKRLGGGPETPYVLRWVLGMTTWALLSISLFLAAMRLICRQKRRFDIVYAHCEYAAPAGFLTRLVHRIPNVTRLYGTFLADLMKRPLIWLRYPIAAGGFLVPHSRLICANDGTRGDWVADQLGINLNRFRFWQDGVDHPPPPEDVDREWLRRRAPSNLRLDSPWVLSCSRLSYWKRIDRMIEALAVAKKTGCDCQLLVAGDGDKRDALRELAHRLGVSNDVVWLGPMPHSDVWTLMALCDAFMITNSVTNRCNPLFEAIRVGLPVVSVHDQSTKDLLRHGENALLADPDDTDRLGEHLAAICSNKALAKRMKDAQRSRDAQLWTWEERMEREVSDLRTLVEEGPSGLSQGNSTPCARVNPTIRADSV